MKVQSHGCCSGSTFWFRLVLPDGRRLRVEGMDWTRAVASAALDEVVRATGAKRKNIRFDHC